MSRYISMLDRDMVLHWVEPDVEEVWTPEFSTPVVIGTTYPGVTLCDLVTDGMFLTEMGRPFNYECKKCHSLMIGQIASR